MIKEFKDNVMSNLIFWYRDLFSGIPQVVFIQMKFFIICPYINIYV